MKHRKIGIYLLLAVILSLAAACITGCAAADGTEAISGSTYAASTFHMYASGNGFVQLEASQGTAYVAGYDTYGRVNGYKAEQDYGFFRVQITKPGYARTFVWAPSATQNTGGIETGTIITVIFPGAGDYTFVITPLTQSEINGTYWPQNRFVCWTADAAWAVTQQMNCSSTPSAQVTAQPDNRVVTVYCYDTDGSFISSYTEPITSSRTLFPQIISGYTSLSSGQFVTVRNGVCSPSSVTFKYKKIQAEATLTVYCYDLSGNYIRSYTETVSQSRTIVPREISGYTAASSGQYVTFMNGACSPASLRFIYQKNQSGAALTVYCYDISGSFIRSYTETVTENRTVYPPSISGYTLNSSAQYVTYANGVCFPASITFYYSKNAVSGQVTVTCRDSRGGVIKTYTETVSGSRTITPPDFTGYRTTSSAQAVTCTDGVCSPAQIEFVYELTTVSPGGGGSSDPAVVMPTLWDTQYKPGTATASNGSNADRIKNLPNLYDNNPDTSFFWLVWNSEWKDDIPEITAYFNGDTVSSIGIRNGNAAGYNAYAKYARAINFTVKVYDTAGTLLNSTAIKLPDYFSPDYRVFSLGGTFENVGRVELYLVNYVIGSTEQNYIHISDIQFYK